LGRGCEAAGHGADHETEDEHERHIVRLTWYVRDMDEYLADLGALGAAYC
jgi:hypothetical protein